MNQVDCAAAFAPLPVILETTDILFDAWSLTTIRGSLPGRPQVEQYLHGISASDPPETYVAWRDEVDKLSADLLRSYPAQDLLEDYPLKPHELLRDRTDRVVKEIKKLAGRCPDSIAWVLNYEGEVEYTRLTDLADGEMELANKTIILPPSGGGLTEDGFLNGWAVGRTEIRYDVADEIFDEHKRRRRLRVWSDDESQDPELDGMRMIRSLEFAPNLNYQSYDEATRQWLWFEKGQAGDTDGSRTAIGAVELSVHIHDVQSKMAAMVSRLPLSGDLRAAFGRAADWHDLGKRRPQFQTMLGNPGNKPPLLAKSGSRAAVGNIREDYRHEFGSLFDICQEQEFQCMNQDMKDLVLHVIAAHHGRARPHFPPDEVFEPEPGDLSAQTIASEVIQRFGVFSKDMADGVWHILNHYFAPLTMPRVLILRG